MDIYLNTYIAGGLFSRMEREYLEKIEYCMKAEEEEKRFPSGKLKTFLPHRDGMLYVPGRDKEEDVFKLDDDKIKRSDILIAYLSGTDLDSGTALEIGMAYAYKIPVFILVDDSRILARMNPMISGGPHKGMYDNIHDMIQGIKKWSGGHINDN